MKQNIFNVLGFLLSGLFVMSIWGPMYDELGLIGGMLASGAIIGLFWNINHNMKLIMNNEKLSFIDMALGIATAGIVRDFLQTGVDGLYKSFPTFIVVLLGGCIGGIMAYISEREEMN